MLRAPTPPEKVCDEAGRPYFLWDVELSLEDYLAKLRGTDEADAGYWLARGRFATPSPTTSSSGSTGRPSLGCGRTPIASWVDSGGSGVGG